MIRSTSARGPALAALAYALFAAHDAGLKALGAYAPIQVAFFLALFGCPLAVYALMRDAAPGTLLPRHPGWVALRTACISATGLLAVTAFPRLPLVETYAILFTTPLIVAGLAALILGERLGPRHAFAIALGLGGALVALRPQAGGLVPGHLAAAGAALCSALAAVATRRIGADERPMVLVLFPLAASLACWGAALPMVYRPMPLADLGLMALVAALAFLGGRLMVAAYARAPAVAIAPLQYTQILWAAAAGALVFAEPPGRWSLAGAGLVALSGALLLGGPRTGRRAFDLGVRPAESSAERPRGPRCTTMPAAR